MRGAGFLLVLVGCYSPAGYSNCEISCASGGGCPSGFTCNMADQRCHAAGGQACPDAAPIAACVSGSLLENYCPESVAGVITFATAATVSTDGVECMDVVAQEGGSEICIYAVAEIVRVSAALTFVGHRPVALVATRVLVIEGNLDVSRGGAGVESPSPDVPMCGGAGPAAIANTGTSGSAGGGGGGFMSPGGTGGAAMNATATTGGLMLPPPTRLRSGCPGGDGGGNDLALNATPGGPPGGGIYLLAGTQVTIAADVYAFGGGGRGTDQTGLGGGGGGSGGMIVVEAPNVMIMPSGKLLAAGGGGGQGANSVMRTGDGGTQPPQSPTMPASGGAISPLGPSGGKGSGASAIEMGGQGATLMGGGGGGGGGAGYIHIPTTSALTNNGVIWPPIAI